MKTSISSSFYPRCFVATPPCSGGLVPITITTRRSKSIRQPTGITRTFFATGPSAACWREKFLDLSVGFSCSRTSLLLDQDSSQPAVPLLVFQTSHNLQQHVQHDREHLQEHPTCNCYRIDSIIALRYLLSPPTLFIVSFHPAIVGRLLLVNHLLYRNSWLCLWFAVRLFLASRTTFVHRFVSGWDRRHNTNHHSKREIRKTTIHESLSIALNRRLSLTIANTVL